MTICLGYTELERKKEFRSKNLVNYTKVVKIKHTRKLHKFLSTREGVIVFQSIFSY